MTTILIVAAVVALVWGTFFVLRGQLVAGCLVVLVAGVCFGYPLVHFDLGPVTLTLDRLALLCLIAAYAVQRRLGRADPKPLAGVDVLLAVLVGVLLVSTLLHDWHNEEFGSGFPLWRLIAGYLIPVTVYWIARQSPLDRSSISLVHGTLACFGVYLAVTGLAEVAGQWWAVFPRYIADPEIGIHFGRARGPMVQSVSYGLYLAICLLCLWFWRQRFGHRGRLVLAWFVPLFLAGIYFSYTRSVWLGTATGALVVCWLTFQKNWRPLTLAVLVSAGLVLTVIRIDGLVSLRRGSDESTANARQSVNMRASFAYVSWLMFQEQPILGHGFGQFPKAKLPYLADRSTGLHLEAIRPYVHHNTLLSLLTEVGLVGFGLFLAVLAGWAHAAWGLLRNAELPDWIRAQGGLLLAVLGIYICQLAFHELTYAPMDNSLVFLLAGVTVGLRQSAAPVAVLAESHAENASGRMARRQPDLG